MSRAREKETAIESIQLSLVRLGVPIDQGDGQVLTSFLSDRRYPSYLLNVMRRVLTQAVTRNVDVVKQKVKAAVE